MAADERWYFTKEQLANTPSRKCGVDADKELSYRQQAANFIQDMGQKLQVTQLCINTAIVYMHRFYVFHSLTQFHRNSIAAAALFLAAKVEEQPRKLEHIIKVVHACLHRINGPVTIDTKSEVYLEQAADLVFNENVLLQTLGFDVAIDHPHTHVVRCCHLVKASKDLAQTSYFMASNSLHLTTMCLQYKPTVVACFCIHLACKWSRWEIPQSNEGKHWFWYVDKTVTVELLQQLTGEFLHIFDKCPSRLRRKMRSISANQSPNMVPPVSNSPFETEPRKVQSPANADGPSFQSSRPFEPEVNKKCSTAASGRPSVDYREYREKKEHERLEREKAAAVTATAPAGAPASAPTSSSSSSLNNNDPNRHHSHHPKQSSSSSTVSNKHTSSSSSSANNIKQGVHHNHHHSSRQDVKSSSQMLQQRHSSGNNQSRDSNRDRQKMSSREYNPSMPHGHSLDNYVDAGISQESATVHPPEKLSNNVHRTAHDSRSNDLRHKQQQQQQKDVKPYGKYPDASSNSSRTVRKPDILDQRSEDIRRLIDKPLPPPKPRAEQIKEDFQMMMLKQSHQQSHQPPKYGHQPEKPVHTVNSTPASLALPGSESKMLNVGQTAFSVEKSPNAPVSASQVPHKSLSSSSSINNHMQPMKNGNSSTGMSLGLINNIDDQKPDKRSQRGQHELENSVSQTPPPTKHRSLFSPDKTPTPSPRELAMAQRMKQKQKSSPAVSSKQDMTLAFASPNLTTSETPSAKQKPMNSSTPLTSQKSHRGLPNLLDNDLDQDSKQQLDHSRKFNSSFGLTDPAGLNNSRYSDLGQSMKHSPLGNKSSVSSLTSLKPEMKPVDNTDPMSNFNQRHKQQHHGMSNGIDSSFVKHEYSTIDPSVFQVKPELPDELLENEVPADLMLNQVYKQESKDFLSYQEPPKKEIHEEPDLSIIKRDSYSPLKSAQSISALLQEPFAAMPSLLQAAYEQKHQPIEDDKTAAQLKQEPTVYSLPSTVDMSDLTVPIQCPVDLLTPVATPVLPQVTPSVTTPSVVEEKKSDHRSKSEKKKEKKKHKHKDKDKSKDKHKHKHKDKDKEKHHRDKGDKEKNNKTDEGNSASSGTAALSAVPIKITIPKDKINLSTDSIGPLCANTSNSGNSLKIKIPKERLKGTELNTSSSQQQLIQQQMLQQQQQASAPLKLKIRTDAIARSDYQNSSQDGSSRKRERADAMDNSPVGAPPAKKQQPQLPLQHQQRPNERQNGRHHPYNSGSSNKVRGGGRGAGPRLPPYPYQQFALAQQQMRDAGYHAYHQQQSPPFMRHPRPPHPYYPNYPPPHGGIQPPPGFVVGYTPGMFDPAMYYQYQQQYAAAMYPTAPTAMMMSEGQLDTSIPPPPMAGRQRHSSSCLSEDIPLPTRPPSPPPLPDGPPPSSSPPPPPPPE